jgi:hypothetical protein
MQEGRSGMWTVKKFKTQAACDRFVASHAIQWHYLFINNVPVAIEYRALRRVY